MRCRHFKRTTRPEQTIRDGQTTLRRFFGAHIGPFEEERPGRVGCGGKRHRDRFAACLQRLFSRRLGGLLVERDLRCQKRTEAFRAAAQRDHAWRHAVGLDADGDERGIGAADTQLVVAAREAGDRAEFVSRDQDITPGDPYGP